MNEFLFEITAGEQFTVQFDGCGEKMKCPYCGATGTLARRFNNGEVFVVHKTEKRMIRGTIPTVVFIDGCWQGRKVGEQNEEFQ